MDADRSGPASADGPRLRLVTLNAEHGRRRDPVSGAPGPLDPGALADAVAALAPDVVALQEVDVGSAAAGGVDQVRVVADALGGAATAFAPRHDGGDSGVALVVRGALDDVEEIRFVSRLGHRTHRLGLPDVLLHPSRRAVLVATARPLAAPGTSITVTSAHLELTRAASHRQLERVLGVLSRRPPGPMALMGDLNRWPRWVGPAVAAVGMRLVEGGGPTAPAHDPTRRIDHVALRGLEAVTVAVAHLPVSDHRAVVVDVVPVASDG